MSALLALFFNNLLPIFLVAGAGYLLAKFTASTARGLSQVIFFIFSPCLVFSLLTQSQLSESEMLRMLLFAVLIMLLVGMLTYLLGRLMGLERTLLAGVLLVAMFMNAGNYGLPVILFAFGDGAASYAGLYFVSSSVLTYTLGVVIASLGRCGLGQAMKNLVKIPTLYALLLAILFLRARWSLPVPIERTVKILSDASIPAMLVVLGMQLQQANLGGRFKPLLLANGMRMVAAPLLALTLSPIFGLSFQAHQAAVLESAMPGAVLSIVLATEYNVEPAFVTAAVFMGTLLSPLILTPLLAVLGGG